MRNLKKILALVLALMMTLSLMVTASAATAGTGYSDDASITKYDEAVQVLDQLGVFRGNEKGEFAPDSTITRAEAAAIVYRIVSGDVNDTQTGIYADYNKFEDVPSTAWYAGYVNFVANGEYIQGDGQGHFYPMAKMNGYQLLAIILRAIGYGQYGEFQGTGWEVRTATQAKALGITSTITTGTLGAPITRAAVAELLFRGIVKTQTVTYSLLYGYQKQNATIASTMFNLAGTRAIANALKAGIPVADAYLGDLLNRSTAESYDVYGEPYYSWYLPDAAGAAVTVDYYLDPVATYTSIVADDVLFAASGKTGTSIAAANIHYEIDGKVQSAGSTPVLNKAAAASVATYGGKGTVTELYVLENGKVAIAEVNTYLGVVETAYTLNANGTIKTNFKLKDIDADDVDSYNSVVLSAGLAAFAKNSLVLYTQYEKPAASGAYYVDGASVHAPKSTNVTVTNTYDTNSVVNSYFLAGAKYEYSAKYDVLDTILNRDDAGFKASQTLYFDDYGYVIYTADPASYVATTGYLVARNGSYGQYVADNQYVASFNVILADGSAATIKGGIGYPYYSTMAAANAAAASIENGVYAYSIDANGYYTLTRADGDTSDPITDVLDGIGGAVALAAGNAIALDPSAQTHLLDAETVFVIANYDVNGIITGYNIVKGIKNIPDMTPRAGTIGIELVYNNSSTDKTIDLVFVTNAVQTADSVGTAVADVLFYLADTTPLDYVSTYDTHTVIKGGAVTTMNFTPNFINNNGTINHNVGFYTVATTTNGYVNGVTPVTAAAVKYAAVGVLKIGSAFEVMADNCVVYDVNTATALTADEIAELGGSDTAVVAARDAYGFATVIYVVLP